MRAYQIELSTVAFYDGRAPRSIALKDCTWPVTLRPSAGLCAVYGTASKRDAFLSAREHATRKGLSFTIIDFIVELEARNQLTMTPQTLSSHDFLNFHRMTKAMGAHALEWLRADKALAKEYGQLFKDLKAEQVLAQHPHLMDELASTRECQHIKLYAFSAPSDLDGKPLKIGFVPFGHWAAIKEATCRLDPTVHVTLDLPKAAKRVRKPAVKNPGSQADL